jgi:hypothetical protein
MNFLLLPAETAKVFGERILHSRLVRQLAHGTAQFGVCAHLGYWRSRRQRLKSYADYLLRQLTAESGGVIVDLAFEEANWRRLHE